MDRESQVIRLVHYTAQDYFQRLRSETSPRNQLDIQIEIVEACITYLGFDDFESDEFTHGESYIKVSDGLRSKYPFLDYAGKYWGHHARGYTELYAGRMITRLLERRIENGPGFRPHRRQCRYVEPRPDASLDSLDLF